MWRRERRVIANECFEFLFEVMKIFWNSLVVMLVDFVIMLKTSEMYILKG